MMIESPVIEVGRSATYMHDFLSDPSNLEGLLPSEHVSDFSAAGEQCSFKVSGGFQVLLKRTGGDPPRTVQYASQKGTPIRFDLEIIIEPVNSDSSSLHVRCDADLNPFMKMVAEKPLQSVFNGMAEAAKAAFPLD